MRACLSLLVVLLCHSSQAAVVDLLVITGEHAACREGFIKVDPKDGLNGDMNQGCGKNTPFIWLCVKYGSPNHNPITALTVVATSDAQQGCGPLGSDWARIGQDQGSNGDFNHGAHGKYVYLCYTRSRAHGSPLAQLNIHEKDCDQGMYRIEQAGESNGDFNQGAHGKFIYLCFSRACVASNVGGEWRAKYVVATETTETWKHGTQKVYTESKTSDWSWSVTASVSQGWNLFGQGGSVTISGQYAQQTSQTYSNEWTTNTEETFQVTWSREDIGKLAWQFVFLSKDSCQHRETTLAQDFALTEGAWRMPCCVPGFGVDRFYTTCHSQDTMIPNGAKQGCKVRQLNAPNASELVI